MKSTVYFLVTFVFAIYVSLSHAKVEDTSLYIDSPQMLSELQRYGFSPISLIQSVIQSSTRTAPPSGPSSSPPSTSATSGTTGLSAGSSGALSGKAFFENPIMRDATSTIR